MCLPVCVTAAIAAPPAPVIDSWAGPYIGAYFTAAAGGRAFEATDQYTFNRASTQVVNGSPSGAVTGSMVDLFVGRNWRFGNFVVGGQAEATISSNINLTNTGPYQTTSINNGVVTSVSTAIGRTDPRLTFRAGLVGRAGFLARPDLLLYGLAGLEFGHFLFPDNDDGFGSANRSFAVGYTAGAGVEARYDQNWSVRAEYRYLHFGTGRWEGLDTQLSTVRYNNINMQVGKLGLVYRFGESGPSAAMAAIPRSPQQVWADSWAGPYAGIYFGAGAGHVAETFSASTTRTQIDTTFFPFPPGASSVTTRVSSSTSTALLGGDVNGSMTELFFGYNWRNGKFVAGMQAEGMLFSDIGFKAGGPLVTSGSSALNGGPPLRSFMVDIGSSNQKLGSAVGLIARAGFLATPELLLYGLGGVEFGHFVYTSTSGAGGDNGKWVAGPTAGAGAELKINDHWSLRGEYRYMHFDVDRNESRPSSSASGSGNSTTTINGISTVDRDTRVDFHVGKIGVVYKFGGAGPASAMAAIPSSVAAHWADGWSGPYFGAYFGAGDGATRGSFAGRSVDNRTGNVNTGNAPLAGGMSGTQVDLFAGFNVRNDRFVLGGQVEATQFSDVSFKTTGTQTQVSTASTSVSTQTLDYGQRLRSMVGVVGRAGFLATPDLLLYGLGGFTLGHFTYPDGSNSTLTTQADTDGKWATGYTVGAGGELKVARHWSLRGEYRYLHFGIESTASFDRVNTPSLSNSTTTTFRTASDYHLGKIGLVYRIGDDPASAMAAMRGTDVCCDRWTGFSAGIYGSAGMGRVQDTLTANSDSGVVFDAQGVVVSGTRSSAAGTLAGDAKGGTIDLFAGYNWRAGKFVVGGQAEATVYADVGMKSRGTLFGTATTLPAGPTGAISGPVDYQQTLRSRAGLIARAGFLATDNLLLYGLAGAEFGHFAFLDGTDPLGGDDGKWAFGYTAGAGGELKLTDRWSLRGEYRYLRFGLDRSSRSGNGSINLGSSFVNAFTGTTRTQVDLNLAKLGVAYSFCYCE